jgi:hypothetical protein
MKKIAILGCGIEFPSDNGKKPNHPRMAHISDRI